MFSKTGLETPPPVWIHWALTCILAPASLVTSVRFVESRRRRWSPAWEQTGILAMAALLFAIVAQPAIAIPHPTPGDQVNDEKLATELRLLSATETDKQFLFDKYAGSLTSIGDIPALDSRTLFIGFDSGQSRFTEVIDKIQKKDYALITTSEYFLEIPPLMEAIRGSYVESPRWTRIFRETSNSITAWEPKPAYNRLDPVGNRGICGESCTK